MSWVHLLLWQAAQSLIELVGDALHRHVEVWRHRLDAAGPIRRGRACRTWAKVAPWNRADVQAWILVDVVLVDLVDLTDLPLDLANLSKRRCNHEVLLRRVALTLHLRLRQTIIRVLVMVRRLRRRQSCASHVRLLLFLLVHHRVAFRLIQHHATRFVRVH